MRLFCICCLGLRGAATARKEAARKRDNKRKRDQYHAKSLQERRETIPSFKKKSAATLQRDRDRYQEHIAEHRSSAAEYYRENREKILEQDKIRYQETGKIRYQENRERIAENYQENREQILEQGKYQRQQRRTLRQQEQVQESKCFPPRSFDEPFSAEEIATRTAELQPIAKLVTDALDAGSAINVCNYSGDWCGVLADNGEPGFDMEQPQQVGARITGPPASGHGNDEVAASLVHRDAAPFKIRDEDGLRLMTAEEFAQYATAFHLTWGCAHLAAVDEMLIQRIVFDHCLAQPEPAEFLSRVVMQKGECMDGSRCDGAVGVGFYKLDVGSDSPVERCRPVYVPDGDRICPAKSAAIKHKATALFDLTKQEGFGTDAASSRTVMLERVGTNVKMGSRVVANTNAFYSVRRDEDRIYVKRGRIEVRYRLACLACYLPTLVMTLTNSAHLDCAGRTVRQRRRAFGVGRATRERRTR